MYKRYFEEAYPLNDLGFTSTFEFFVQNGKLMCEYNGSNPKPLLKFLNKSYYPEINPLFQKMAQHIVKKYGHFDSVKYWVKSRMKWEEILLQFIVKYFGKYNKELDVIVKANGDVTFNLEESFDLNEKVDFPFQISFLKSVTIKQPSYNFKPIVGAIYKRKSEIGDSQVALYGITDFRKHGIDIKKVHRHDLQISYSDLKKLADKGVIQLFGTKLN